MLKTKVVLSFPPSSVEEPITYHLIKDFGIMVNILRASISPGKKGRMVVELSGEESIRSQALNYLESKGVEIDELAAEIRYLENRCASCTACVPVCPTGALDVDRNNWKVSFFEDKCVVCLSCVDACPYRAVEIGQE